MLFVEWDEFYHKRFIKAVKKRDEKIDHQKEKQFQQIMSIPNGNNIGPMSSQGPRIEDRLLMQGQKYQDNLKKIR